MALYTTPAEMQRFASEAGHLAIASDDDPPTAAEANVEDDAAYEASETIDLYLLQRYTTDALAASQLVRRWATLLGCICLRRRRGQSVPESWLDHWEQIELKLQKIQQGLLQLGGVASRALGISAPTTSHIAFRGFYQKQKIRVDENSSVAPPPSLPLPNDPHRSPTGGAF